MQIAEQDLNLWPKFELKYREKLEMFFSGSMGALACSAFPGLEGTDLIIQLMLGNFQNTWGNLDYHKLPQLTTTDWPRFVGHQLWCGTRALSVKIIFDLCTKGDTVYSLPVITTALAVTTASASLFRLLTKD